ncbi:MAG TPA: helix-turn-helix domain-containing protein [Nevskiaceae bacterium]|nr:helix-turn-helix domain-containing protein [Nevskiaceae bacterium]
MGTRERRQREVAEREQFFLQAARVLIREEGLLNLQMSRVAERCEYAVGTLYQHFTSKEDLVLALAAEGSVEHAALFDRVQRWQASSRDRMFAIGVCSSLFVRRNPDHFRISQYALCDVVWRAASASRREAFLEVSNPIGAMVTGIVEDGVREGALALRGLSPGEFTVGLWALCMGTHNLVHTEGILDQMRLNDPYRLLCRHINGLLNGYSWKPWVDPADDAALDALFDRICHEVFDDLRCAD